MGGGLNCRMSIWGHMRKPQSTAMMSLAAAGLNTAFCLSDDATAELIQEAAGVAAAAAGFLSLHSLAKARLLANAFVVLALSAFQLFAVYVSHYRESVQIEPGFDFSVLTPHLLMRVMLANSWCISVVLCVHYVFSKRIAAALNEVPQRATHSSWFTRKWLEMEQPVAPLLAMGGLGILVLFNYPNVAVLPYPENQLATNELPSAARTLLVLASYAALRPLLNSSPPSGWFFYYLLTRGVFFFCVISFGILSGTRGAVFGVLLLLIADEFKTPQLGGLKKILTLGIPLTAIAYLLIIWPAVRADWALMGFGEAQATSVTTLLSLAERQHDGRVLLTNWPLVCQSLFHFLYVISLIESGDSLAGRSFIVLPAQSLPAVLDGILWERPINDAWLLAERYAHEGAFYVPANLYWNGGGLVMILSMAILAFLICYLETEIVRSRRALSIGHMILVFLVPINMFYGLQPLVRGIEVGAIVWFLGMYFEKVSSDAS